MPYKVDIFNSGTILQLARNSMACSALILYTSELVANMVVTKGQVKKKQKLEKFYLSFWC